VVPFAHDGIIEVVEVLKLLIVIEPWRRCNKLLPDVAAKRRQLQFATCFRSYLYQIQSTIQGEDPHHA
jgi:hypothetical protein